MREIISGPWCPGSNLRGDRGCTRGEATNKTCWISFAAWS